MSIEAFVYPAPVELPNPRIQCVDVNSAPNALDRNAFKQNAYLGSIADSNLRVYFPTRSYLPEYTIDCALGTHIMVAHGPYGQFRNYEQMLDSDRVKAAEIALTLVHEGYIVGSNRDKRHHRPDGIPTSQSWRMFHMHAVKFDLPAPSEFDHVVDIAEGKLRERLPETLSYFTRAGMKMFPGLRVLSDTHVGGYPILNGAVAKIDPNIQASRLAGLLLNIDNQISHLWHVLPKQKTIYERGFIGPLTEYEEYQRHISRLKRLLRSVNGASTVAPSYSWTLVKHDKDLLLAVSPHIRSGGGFLETLGIVPVRTPTPGYSHKPALERAREAVNGFAGQWGLTQQANQPRGTLTS